MDASAKTSESKLKRWRHQSKEVLKVMSVTPKVLKLIWNANKKLTFGVFFLSSLSAVVPVIELELTRALLDTMTKHIGTSQNLSAQIFLLIAGMALTGLIFTCIEPTRHYFQENLGDILTRDINALILRKASSFQDLAPFENPEFYDKLTKAEDEAGYKPLLTLTHVAGLFYAAVGLGSFLVVLLSFQPLLVLIIAATALPNIIVQCKASQASWAINRFETPEVREMHYVRTVLTRDFNAKEVRLLHLRDYFLDRYQRLFERFRQRHQKLRFDRWRNGTWLSVLAAIGSAGCYAYIAAQAVARTLSVGSLTLYLAAVDRVTIGMSNLTYSVGSLYDCNLFISNLFEFLDAPPTMAVPTDGTAVATPRMIKDGIEFKDIVFKYPDAEKPTLDGLSFHLRRGQTVALVGENGAGKTTIVKLLTRLYDPTSGEILIDGVNLREHDLKDWRSQLGVIFQDFNRYYLTARENIGIGKVELLKVPSAVEHATELGGALSVIDTLPNKFESILGKWFDREEEKSVELSGGQWQKVALARTFMRSLGTKVGETLLVRSIGSARCSSADSG